MVDTPGTSLQLPDVEIAAGGLVWERKDGATRLGIVRRAKRADCSLPKGKPKPEDVGLKATATREVMEELGCQVDVGEFAGCYSYLNEGKPKVVLMWHMTKRAERSDNKPDKGEIADIEWRSAGTAIGRLSHATEKEFVARHRLDATGAPPDKSWSLKILWFFKRLWSFIRQHPEFDRLEAEIGSVREQLHAALTRGTTDKDQWWVDSVDRSLDRAEKAWREKHVDIGWAAVHDAQRFLVFGMSNEVLVTRALSLRAEMAKKLGKWRQVASARLFESIDADSLKKSGDDALSRIQSVVSEALCILNESGQNSYHRIRLVGQQMRYLIWIGCVLLIATVPLVASLPYRELPKQNWQMLASVALFGGVGATVTALYQLSRAGDAKIPESTLHGVITLGRPLVGALAALFIYVALESRVISLIKAEQFTAATAWTLAFVSGFSETFIVRTVGIVTGDNSTGGTHADQDSKSKQPRGEK